MKLRRALKHLVTPDAIALRPFPKAAIDRIEQAITRSEQTHSGELKLALEAGLEPLDVLRGMSARARALDVFTRLRVWDTDGNSGVLVYLQMVDHRIEIVADRGIDRRVAQAEWDAICRRMEAAFRASRFEAGVIEAVGEITALLARHFPPGEHNPDELPDRPVVLL
ncbi:MAG: TPM domain-containing protein [Burkholderiales bacterium]|nr:TPM domain-containing protein [Burkholderiales bacterium]